MLRDKLGNARSSKKDEFYTLYKDVKFELDHYIDQFKDKVIYCPCDTEESAFVKYFLELKAKGLIKELLYTSLQSRIDFLSDTAIDNYKRSDVVITNPPFSLFRPFLSLLNSLNKKFIIWGNTNALTYKLVMNLLVHNKILLGHIANKTCEFVVHEDYASCPASKAYKKDNTYYIKVPAISTFTNLNVNRISSLILTRHFDDSYIKYDNFDAVNCNKATDIPIDYNEYIGVPVTYLTKHDPAKFDIIGLFNHYDRLDFENGIITGTEVKLDKPPWRTRGPCINGKALYARLVIKKKINN